jgi:hypothetical protein
VKISEDKCFKMVGENVRSKTTLSWIVGTDGERLSRANLPIRSQSAGRDACRYV